MEKVVKMMGLTAGQIFRYGLMASMALAMLGIGSSYITCLLGVAYPAFMSFLALESKKRSDDKQWLTYWVVYGFLSFFDKFGGSLMTYVPFYFFVKLLVLVWLFHPSSRGATRIYDMYVLPNMKKYNEHIVKVEKGMAEAASAAKVKLDSALNQAIETATK